MNRLPRSIPVKANIRKACLDAKLIRWQHAAKAVALFFWPPAVECAENGARNSGTGA